MKPRLGVRGGESIKKNHYEISNKHLFSNNKLSTKEKTQNHCFLIHYNVIIYEKGT